MGAENECIPFYEPGSRVTGHCEAAVTGKRFVDISDDRQGPVAGAGLGTNTDGGNIVVSHASAGGNAIGVSSHDAAIAKKVTILGAGFIVPVTADGAINSGDEVMVGATGKAKAWATGNRVVGRAWDDAADGAPAMIQVYGHALGLDTDT